MSKGLRHDPLADIELIRQNLKDRYSEGFPILKELIQNAEDSYASKVVFAWTPGLDEARHPLLRGPALIAVNDGPFTSADRDSAPHRTTRDSDFRLPAMARVERSDRRLILRLCRAALDEPSQFRSVNAVSRSVTPEWDGNQPLGADQTADSFGIEAKPDSNLSDCQQFGVVGHSTKSVADCRRSANIVAVRRGGPVLAFSMMPFDFAASNAREVDRRNWVCEAKRGAGDFKSPA